jgi:hypothetical protein
MRYVQLMRKNKNIFRVYHIRIIAKKIGSHNMKQTDSSIFYLSIHDCLSFLHEVMIGNHRIKTFLHEVMIGTKQKVNQFPQQWRGR